MRAVNGSPGFSELQLKASQDFPSQCWTSSSPLLRFLFQWIECNSVAQMRKTTDVGTWKLLLKLRMCSRFSALKILLISLQGYTAVNSVLICKSEFCCKRSIAMR